MPSLFPLHLYYSTGITQSQYRNGIGSVVFTICCVWNGFPYTISDIGAKESDNKKMYMSDGTDNGLGKTLKKRVNEICFVLSKWSNFDSTYSKDFS